jgi:hypothetical protein
VASLTLVKHPRMPQGESSWKKQDTPLVCLRRYHFITPGLADAHKKNHVFRVQGLFKHSSQTLDTLETLKILKLSKRKVFREIEKGMIKSAATIPAIFLAYIGDMDKNNYSNKHD